MISAMNDRDRTGSTPDGTEDRHELVPGEEPVVTGTLFLTMVILMMIFGFWTMFYITLISK